MFEFYSFIPISDKMQIYKKERNMRNNLFKISIRHFDLLIKYILHISFNLPPLIKQKGKKGYPDLIRL